MKSTAYRSIPLVAFAAAVLLLGLWPALPSQADGVDVTTQVHAFDGVAAGGNSVDVGNDRQQRGQARSSSSSSSSSRASSSRSSSGSSRGSSSTGSSGSSSSSSGSSTSSSDSSSGSSRSSASSSRGSSSSSRGSSARSSASSSSSRGSASSSSSRGSARDSASSTSSSQSSRGTTTRSSGTRSSSSDSGRSSRGTATTRSSSSDSGRASRGTTTRSSSGDSGRTSRGTTTRTTTSGDSGSYRTDRGRTDTGRTDAGRTDTGRTNTTTGGTSTRTSRDYPGYDRGGRTRTDTPAYTGGGGGTDYGPRLDRAYEDRTDNYRGRRTDRRGYHDHYGYDYPHRSYYWPYDYWYWNFGIGPAGYWAWSWGWDYPFYGGAWDAGWSHYNYGYTSPTVFWSANVGWGVQANVAFPIYTPYYRYHYERSNLGGIDLNVNPQDAGVYLNGQYIGVVDEFNGWPGYLWLEEGIYHLVVYKEGYETISREYTIQRGVVLNVRDRMSIGIATHPDEVPVPPRVRYQIEAQRQAEDDRLAARDSSEDEWRQRAAEYLARRDAEQYEADQGSRPGGLEGVLDARVAPARLNIDAVPADASVYLDGAFLGTAADLASRGGVLVDPGNHVLELVRPGYDSKQRSFTVEAGDQLQLNLQLEKAGSQGGEEGVAVSSLAP